MVSIRFARVGLKGQPEYRIIVADSRRSRGGKYIEIIGHHNPRTRPSTDIVNEARALYWLSVGAQPTDAVKSVFNRTGTLARFERMKKGESVEALVAEAEANKVTVDPRTNYPSPEAGKGKKAREAAKNSEA
ncbi:MAG: 30S ribosomal protein S16 [Phototrophicales bacterium]|jgi:small subunit ribosomal protein S16|nr:MAG: 30S ribosomal protein S16 [Phototrophicales bacterium]